MVGESFWQTGSAGGASALDDLTDVDTATTPPTDGQVLVYDSGSATWLPGTVAASGGSGGGSGGLLVRDGVIPLEPVGMDGASDTWLYSDPTSDTGSGGVTDHGALTGLTDNDHPQYVVGQDGRNYRMVAAVIRKSGGSWGFIDDAGHRPLGFDSITASSTEITLGFSFTAVKVASVVVGPDETYAEDYSIGASVGYDDLYLKIYSGSALVNPTTMADSSTGNFWILGLLEV